MALGGFLSYTLQTAAAHFEFERYAWDFVNRPFSPTASLSAPNGAEASLRAKFGHIDAWVFDLDNTLYPSDSDLWPNIDKRITLFLMALFGIDGLSARALQKHYYRRHGTTLRGLIDENMAGHEEFLAFVHDIDRSTLLPNPSLAEQIAALPGRKLIFTNGSRDHALRTAAQLGMGSVFEDVFDIVASNLIPKPAAAAYAAFFDKHGVDPARAAMFEDVAKNLAVPRALGMTTTLVIAKVDQADHREAHDRAVDDAHAIDFATSDLAGFLASVNARLRGG
jgi:putative hydrolase of the HAD superfamily